MRAVEMWARSGTPESVVTAPPGYVYVRTDTGVVYVKNTGSSNTGWVDLVASGVQAGILIATYFRDTISSPSQIASNQDNYNPGTAGWLRLTTDASRDITGFTGGATGRTLTVTNVGSFNVVLREQTTSTAANQIITGTGADITLSPLDTAILKYDSTSSRWRVVNHY